MQTVQRTVVHVSNLWNALRGPIVLVNRHRVESTALVGAPLPRAVHDALIGPAMLAKIGFGVTTPALVASRVARTFPKGERLVGA